MGIIRNILACFVVLYHCGQFDHFAMMQGPEAVQSFYIISGFYMALILNEKYVNQKNAYKLFITNRLLKLFPAYWFVLFLTLVVSVASATSTHGANWAFLNTIKDQFSNLNFATKCYLILSNIAIIGQDVSLFLGFDSHSGNLFFTDNYAQFKPEVYLFILVPQAWTISIEILFYIIAPIFARKSIRILLCIILIPILIKYFLFKSNLNYDPWTYRFFPAEMLFFLLGILSYKLYSLTSDIKIPKPYLLVSFVITMIVIFSFQFIKNYFSVYFYFIGLALAIPLIFRYTKNNKWDRIIGDYSYPIYIFHVFVKGLVFLLFGSSSNVSIQVLLGSFLLAFIFNYFINSKIEMYRQKRVQLIV